MRYTSEHKDQSRQRLIAAAARLFRKHGYDGVGINDLCAEAGLTRGAFYGHFDSKQALLSAVLAGAHDFVRRLKARTARSTSGLRRQAAGIARAYLAPDNRRAVAAGCSIAALAVDCMRGEPASQQAYASGVRALVTEFQRGADGDRLSADSARAALALCVGGLLIDNACGSDPEGQRVARAAQKEVTRLLAGA